MSYIFVTPGMSPKEIVKKVRELPGVALVSVGMRDAGQSDYKNRLRIYDLKTLAPFIMKWDFLQLNVMEGQDGMWV